MPRATVALFAAALVGAALADGPADNAADKVRPVPPPGVNVATETRAALTARLAALQAELNALPAALAGKPDLLALVPDAEVFHKAVRYALEYDELYSPAEVAAAAGLLKQGAERAAELMAGRAPWTTATGLVVRGYRSKIDGSVQPYGLVIPPGHDHTKPTRLDVWWHGRAEKLSEVAFILDRQKNPGEFAPANAVVLHPYGRYCNANKFAGEVDTFEAIDHLKRTTAVDAQRVIARGFSMGGAACWQFATHYPAYWRAAAPGAGFSETPEFLGNFQGETVKPTWYEKRLWHLTNATDYAANLFNLPTVAYSGDKDKQKQAADAMAKAMRAEGLELAHVIGKDAGHKYTAEAKADINARIDGFAAKGRNRAPANVRFTTFTLRYPESHWVRVEGMGRHWHRARVDAEVKDGVMTVKSENVTKLTITATELGVGKVGKLVIDESVFTMPRYTFKTGELQGPMTAVSGAYTKSADGKWMPYEGNRRDSAVVKKPGLQGPIDDAFLDRFVMVRPTGQPLTIPAGEWAAAEMAHAVAHWRKQFRGDAVVVDDTAVTDEQIKNANLVLWGDPRSNAVLARIAGKLPIVWTAGGVTVGTETYPAGTHVPVLIYPNPLNPEKYVVLNSGFTFREYDYLNNARQVAKLPDYAVLDISVPPTPRAAGKVERAGFFGERWELLPKDGE